MPKFEGVTNPREDFNKNEEDAEGLNAQLAEAMNSKNYAEVGAIAKKLEETAGNKDELIDNAQEEAEKEAEQRDLGAEMAKDTEAEIAAKELEDLKTKDETDSAEKADEILQQINGEGSEKVENNPEKFNQAYGILMNVFRENRNDRNSIRGKNNSFSNPFGGGLTGEHMELREEIESLLEDINQKDLAEKFFEDTIGKNISNNMGAYNVYGLLRGTEFANKFKELESARLERAGYGKFIL